MIQPFFTLHVDDLLMAGNKRFEKIITEKLMKQFKFSKLERGKFKYLGCEIEKIPDGDISLNQNEYIQNIEEFTFHPKGIVAEPMIQKRGK